MFTVRSSTAHIIFLTRLAFEAISSDFKNV